MGHSADFRNAPWNRSGRNRRTQASRHKLLRFSHHACRADSDSRMSIQSRIHASSFKSNLNKNRWSDRKAGWLARDRCCCGLTSLLLFSSCREVPTKAIRDRKVLLLTDLLVEKDFLSVLWFPSLTNKHFLLSSENFLIWGGETPLINWFIHSLSLL